MIRTVAVQGYRSLRDLLLPLGQLSVITGANSSSKSSVYRSDSDSPARAAQIGTFSPVLRATSYGPPLCSLHAHPTCFPRSPG